MNRLQARIAATVAFAAIAFVVAYPRHAMVLPIAHTQPQAKRPPMPNFTFQTLTGKPWTLSQHRGHVILLNFWATWCPPCHAETPDLVKLAHEYQGHGLDVVGVSMDNSDLSGVQDFVRTYHIPYPILLPPLNSPVIAPIQAYPTTVVIDRKGRIAAAFVGELDVAAFQPELNTLLREPYSSPKTAHKIGTAGDKA